MVIVEFLLLNNSFYGCQINCVIGWMAVVFRINSSRIVNRKVLPVYNVRTINPEYYSLLYIQKLQNLLCKN